MWFTGVRIANIIPVSGVRTTHTCCVQYVLIKFSRADVTSVFDF